MNEQAKRLTTQFLANRHHLMAYIYGLARDANVSEDIFQEVWLKLVEAAERNVWIEDSVKWCRGVARNLLLHHWREQRTARVVADSRLMDLIEQAFEEQDERRGVWTARQQALRDCMKIMPEKSKRVLELKYSRGLSVTDIAELLRKSSAGVMMFLSRIRQALAECAEEKLKFSGI